MVSNRRRRFESCGEKFAFGKFPELIIRAERAESGKRKEWGEREAERVGRAERMERAERVGGA